MPESYTPKEIALFQAVEKLLGQGHKLHQLKVSDITATACMGKGTAYDYFRSKEEIIRGAIRYRVSAEFNRFHDIMFNDCSFRKKFMSSLDLVWEMMQRHLPRIRFMLQTLADPEHPIASPDEEIYYCQLLQRSNNWILAMLRQGSAEGYLHPQTSDSWRLFAFRGVVWAFAQAIQTAPADVTDLTDKKQAAWEMLLRTLSRPWPEETGR